MSLKLSSKTRYGVRLMISLAEKFGEGPIMLKDIALEQGISEKYLSLIVMPLRSADMILSTRGAHGGYALSRPPSEITLKNVVETLEGETFLVQCVKDADACPRVPTCPTRDVWSILTKTISGTLERITLEQLVRMLREKENNLAGSDI